ncbi:hypothetical protein LZ554_004316 [Drepanopeziza brunnea f. sp. 'monogermtubi']|nr:hypothetical protein LZ554_004316 [Drepanopeziza brunnea f. sp. 'monogermtubi']
MATPPAHSAANKKRGAAAEFEKSDSKKKADASKDNSAAWDDQNIYPPKILTAEDRLEQARKTARYVDDETARRNAILEENEFRIANPTWNTAITSQCPAWVHYRTELVADLRKGPVKDVLDNRNIKLDAEGPKDAKGNPLLDRYGRPAFNFDRFKYLLLVPPPMDGLILQLQTENAILYKQALKTDQFKGAHDNLATKLTMLHFGLPIEPFTINNLNRAEFDDGDDPEDDALGPLQVQRINYAEKPLEFLDEYHERGYGFHILRRAKPKHVMEPTPQTTLPVPPAPLNLFGARILNPPAHHHHGQALAPLQPTGQPVGLRGGAGNSTTRTIYNHFGGSYTVNVDDDTELVSPEDFLRASLYLLDLHKNSSWIIVFDQYNNSERYKEEPIKKFVRSFEVSKIDFAQKYEAYLRARISNKLEDWIIVVQYKHIRDREKRATPTFQPPRGITRNSTGQLPAHETRPLNAPSATHLPPSPQNSPSLKSETRFIFRHDDGHQVTQSAQVTDSAQDFARKSLNLLEMTHNDWKFFIDFYGFNDDVRRPGNPILPYHSTIVVTSATMNALWLSTIQTRLFGSLDLRSKWRVVIRAEEEDIDPTFNPSDVESDSSTTSSSPSVAASGTGQTEPSIPKQGPLLKNHIYGYRGTTPIAKLDEKSFAEAALAILALDHHSNWNFYMDIIENGASKTVAVSKASWSRIFKDHVQKFGKQADGGIQIFVRDVTALPQSEGQMQPAADLDNLVRLTDGTGRTAYWAIPNSGVRFGVNQLQDDFFSAMQVFFNPGNRRPSQHVVVGGADLGPGGMELTQQLWTQLARDAQDPSKLMQYAVTLEDKSLDRMTSGELLPVRLAGATSYGYYTEGNYDTLAAELNNLLDAALALGGGVRKPAGLVLWYTPEDREDGLHPLVLRSQPEKTLAERLKSWVEAQNGRKTNCVWFRPVWEEFEIVDVIEPSKSSVWKPAMSNGGASLSAFRAELSALLPGSNTDGFQIALAESSQRFVVDINTTEDQWRRNLFDYLLGPRLHVRLTNDIVYNSPNTIPPWGIWRRTQNAGITAPPVTILPATGHPVTPLPAPELPTKTRAPHHQHHQHHQPPHSPAPPLNDHTGPPEPVKQPPFTHNHSRRIPGERAHVPRPAQRGLNEILSSDRHAQNSLQQRSWTQDQSVVEPGFKPAAPLYGDVSELALTVGSNLPTVFAQHLTPTDIAQLIHERRKAVNHALERQIACPICPQVFTAYNVEAKKKHFEMHGAQLNAGRLCPMCGIDWTFMTFEQRKDHIIACQIKTNKEDVMNFWAATRCPICNDSFAGRKAEAVINHLAAHIPGTLKYCDRCSLDLSSCTGAERNYHDSMCVHTKDKPAAADTKCHHCGREKVHGEEEDHDTCGDNVSTYCTRCGFLISNLRLEDQHAHRHRCRVLCGPTGTFCKRCGIDLSVLDSVGHAFHNNECYLREPFAINAQTNSARARSINGQQIQNNRDSSELKQQRADLAQRLRDLRDKEHGLLIREAAVNGQSSPQVRDLGACAFDSCHQHIGLMTREQMFDHFNGHAASGSGSSSSPGDRINLGICPIRGCGANLNGKIARDLIAHIRTHSGLGGVEASSSGGNPCDTVALQKALQAFKARMPEFKEAHKALQNLATTASQNSLRAPETQLAGPNPAGETGLTPQQHPASAEVRQHQQVEQALHAANDAALDTQVDIAQVDDNPADTTQTGFLPSPPRASLKEFRPLRKSRSVRGRPPTTSSKRKKAAMDDSEDTLSGGPTLQRSPSKRETKKMKTTGEGMSSSPDKRKRRQVIAAGEGDGSSGFDGGEGLSVTMAEPKRMTRAAAAVGAADRRVGRPRGVALEEQQAEDDGFEDVEEEDEDEEEVVVAR